MGQTIFKDFAKWRSITFTVLPSRDRAVLDFQTVGINNSDTLSKYLREYQELFLAWISLKHFLSIMTSLESEEKLVSFKYNIDLGWT